MRPPETRHILIVRLGDIGIQELIGHGGMGVVLKGFQPVLKRLVAVKLLAPQLAVSAAARKVTRAQTNRRVATSGVPVWQLTSSQRTRLLKRHNDTLPGKSPEPGCDFCVTVPVRLLFPWCKHDERRKPNSHAVLLPLCGGSSFIAVRAAVARVITGWNPKGSSRPGITRRAFSCALSFQNCRVGPAADRPRRPTNVSRAVTRCLVSEMRTSVGRRSRCSLVPPCRRTPVFILNQV